jgi:aryl-alcohol dehydrogenase-like predicted oxidoreductase
MLFTKCGFVWGADRAVRSCITGESIRNEIQASLRRLEVQAIDLYQIHWVEPDDDSLIEEAWGTLVDLQRAGLIRHIGVSNFDVAQLGRAAAIAPVDTLQPPYSLLDRAIEPDLLPYCVDHDIGVIVYSPMQSGLLTGAMTRERIDALPHDDARRSDPNFSEPALSANLEFVAGLERLAGGWGWPAGRAAIAWTLDNPAVSGAIVGFRRPAQVAPILAGGAFALVAERRQAIDEIAGGRAA